jgi:hypothetical protein
LSRSKFSAKNLRFCHAERRKAFHTFAFCIYFLLSAKQKKVTKKSSPLRKNLMKTTQSPAPDEKNSPPAAAQTVFHLLPNPSCLFSTRFSRGGSFISQI